MTAYKATRKQTIKRQSISKTPKIVKSNRIVNKIKDKLLTLKQMGEQKGIVAYDPTTTISTIAFFALMKKYESRCIVHGIAISARPGVSTVTAEDIHQPSVYSKLGILLKNCVQRGADVVCILTTIEFEDGNDHINMLIYRPLQKIVERFEPHGSGDTLNEFDNAHNMNNSINQRLKTLWEKNLTKWIGKVAYIPSNDICPRIRGLQALENELEYIDKEGGGFCAMWSVFMAEMVILNPEKTTKTILDEIFAITKSDPFFVKSVIRGFVIEIEHELDSLLKKIGKVGFTYEHEHPYDQLFDTPDIDSIDSNSSDFAMHRLDRWVIDTLQSQHS